MPRGVVKKVIDGDTIELKGGERVRIAALNAPELGERGGEAAKRKLGDVLKAGTDVGLSTVLAKSYNRNVRRATVQGKSIVRLVQQGSNSSSRKPSPRRK